MKTYPPSKKDSLVKRWYLRAKNTPEREAVIHWTASGDNIRWTYSSLVSRAEEYASYLRSRGIRKGDVCAMIFKHNPEFYPLYLGISILGAVPAVLAYPNPRLHKDKFAQGIEGMLRHSGLDWVLAETSLQETLDPFLRGEIKLRGLCFPLEDFKPGPLAAKERERIRQTALSLDPGRPALLQHSSGTTGLQKAVVLTHETVLGHLETYSRTLALTDQDRIVSWLPLYHDMGLIAAFHLPLAMGIPSVQIDPFEWVIAPSLLFEAVSREKGTLSWMPNFAFNLCADKIHDDEITGITLKSWRMVINCSETVRDESHRLFLKRFSKFGLKKEAVSTAYAMAETTFAVSQSLPGEKPLTCQVGGRMFVSSGSPINGCRVKILGAQGKTKSQGPVGEILIKSSSLFKGYRNNSGATRSAMQGGWYHTGDLGFLYQGEIFVTGRKKDLIIVGGNNIFPEDVESAVSRVPGVIPGRVVAFGMEDPELGTEQVCVAAETRAAEAAERQKLESEIIRAGMGADVSIRKVFLVPPRWIIKSSSGKPSRQANKDRIVKQEAIHDIG